MLDDQQMEITGTLNNWFLIGYSDKAYWIEGEVSGDTKGRFKEDAYIHTSAVIKIDKEQWLAYTLYSIYELGLPRSEEDPFKIELFMEDGEE